MQSSIHKTWFLSRIKYLYSVLLMISAVACAQVEEKRNIPIESDAIVDSTKITSSQMSDSTLIPSFYGTEITDNVGRIEDLQVVGDYLLITSDHTNGYISVFSVSVTTQLLTFAGRNGSGPHEFQSPPSMIRVRGTDDSIQFYDFYSKKIVTADASKLVDSGEFDQTFLLPSSIGSSQQSAVIGEGSIIIGRGGVQGGALVRSSTASLWIPNFASFYPVMDDIATGVRVSHIYEGTFAVDETVDRIYSVSKYFNHLEIFDTKLNLIRRTTSDRTDFPNFEMIGGEPRIVPGETVFRFTDIELSRDYIFVLDANRIVGSTESCMNSKLVVYNFEGDLIRMFDLHGCPTRITYDASSHRIISYFASATNLDEYVGYYQLPHFKDGL